MHKRIRNKGIMGKSYIFSAVINSFNLEISVENVEIGNGNNPVSQDFCDSSATFVWKIFNIDKNIIRCCMLSVAIR